ncbi:methylated-DNA--[protein]-cysteine S-methyltransferase [Microaerobacter geothermalis]|uniref:methylated-DNA--[protein]-cysteine S-methyltransferase n=1 Tax=Microaerobacter geothermalis TaxID=674972 RepID=UPI001F478E34|nr:methylated-DNA--[protein]-cysteine S-methyltransferase [Microaerobacter geothermalis]MCF6094597.1 methylated-DNA--[protein]-cysteine S-methyltransferase [Microaerobacter geothermalis]
MKRRHLIYAEMDSPIGDLTIVSSPVGICSIEFGSYSQVKMSILRMSQRMMFLEEPKSSPDELFEVIRQLNEYFDRKRKYFQVPLDLVGTPFQKKVWHQLQQIPYGETKSYKEVASLLHSPKAVRAVGGANNKNPVPIIVPCHRVVGSNGALVGYGGGIGIKEYLLQLEGCENYLISI